MWRWRVEGYEMVSSVLVLYDPGGETRSVRKELKFDETGLKRCQFVRDTRITAPMAALQSHIGSWYSTPCD